MFKGLNCDRSFLLSIAKFATLYFAVIFFDSTVSAQQTIDLIAKAPSSVGQRVKVRVSVKGDLLVNDEEETSSTPLNVTGSFDYQEKTLRSAKSIRAVRRYDIAVANIQLGKEKTASTLATQNRWIVVDRKSKAVGLNRVRFLTSGNGLSQKEFELLALPANSMFFDRCIEKKGLKRGDTWQPDHELLADLLFVDEIVEKEFQFRLKEFNESTAYVGVSGQLTARVDDIQTDMQIRGQFEFDLKGGFTRGLRLTIGERREIGQIAPGFEVTTTIAMKVDRRKTLNSITDASLSKEGISKRKWSDDMMISSKSGRFTFRHQRDWRVINNEKDAVIWRCIQDGLVLAQCTAIPLPNLPSDDYSLKSFAKDVAKNTADKARLVDTKEWSTKRGHKVFRIQLAGKEGEVAITWLYFHIAQTDGQRASLIVSYDDAIAEVFEGREEILVESIKFTRPTQKTVNKPRSKTTSRR